jgi:hypothetical protein
MSLRIIDAAIETEQSDQLHEARLLLLLRHAAARGTGTVEGITKLAKIDFLLRYPLYFQRIVDKLNKERKKPILVPIQPYEADTVESKMIRFRYGPWDPRYRRWIGILVAKGLADTYLQGRTVHVRLTEEGLLLASKMAEQEVFEDLDIRSRLIDKTVGAKSGRWLKETIYEVVPELTGMDWGEEIEA